MPRNIRSGVLVSVSLSSLTTIEYGFISRLIDSQRNDFGQTVISPAKTSPNNIIIGANAPKPARATKKQLTGSFSSYCDKSKVGILRAAGFTIKPEKPPRRGRSSDLADLFYITINGIKYAWYSTKSNSGTPPGYPLDLGIKEATGDDKDLIFGCSFPKPPTVKTTTPNGNSFASFCDPAKVDDLLDAKWKVQHNGSYLIEALRARTTAVDSSPGGNG